MNKTKDFLKLTCNYRDSHYKLAKRYDSNNVLVRIELFKNVNNNGIMIYESTTESAMEIYLNLLGLNFKKDFIYHYGYHHSFGGGYTEYYETEITI